ncbi:MAG: TetR/AcrR family transcriptional regulator [Desulfobacterales bacterium]|nr:TetR/AcrR family transcriptional regulator [Desulfobacterales bacterium]
MPDSDKRHEILKAASHCFAHFGFSKTTMDDIGGMVGLNKASLYYYYKNKEAIFCEIIEQEGKGFIAGLKEKIETLTDWDEKIQAYLLERHKYFQQTVNLHNLSIQTAEQLKFQPIFRELAIRFLNRETDLIKEILDQALAKHAIQEVDTKKTASIILSVSNSLKNEHLHDLKTGIDPGALDKLQAIEENTRFAVGLILNGLKIKP